MRRNIPSSKCTYVDQNRYFPSPPSFNPPNTRPLKLPIAGDGPAGTHGRSSCQFRREATTHKGVLSASTKVKGEVVAGREWRGKLGFRNDAVHVSSAFAGRPV